MLRSNVNYARVNVDNFIATTDFINMDVLAEIDKELQKSSYDVISLVFLLYDVADTALQKLVVYQRLSKDVRATNLNLLQEWYRYAKAKPSWKYELLEALIICQMYSIIRKLGFHVSTLKLYFQPDNLCVHMYINPVKKTLYRVCETLTFNNFMSLKRTLLTYDIDTLEYESCEMVFLKLMCQKFIILYHFEYNKIHARFEYRLERLIEILESFSGMQKLILDLRHLQTASEEHLTNSIKTSTPLQIHHIDTDNEPNRVSMNANKIIFEESFKMLTSLNIEEDGVNYDILKSNCKTITNCCYKIKNPNRLGVCLIINQSNFYPSKKSIENGQEILKYRLGSDKDVAILRKTMNALNFEIISYSNLDHKEIFESIKMVIRDKVRNDDSMFMLCFMSHGIRGHVFAADSVVINVEDIENYLDSDEALKLRGMPKVVVIQACQVDDSTKSIDLIAADCNVSTYFLKKCDFIIFWATAPEFKAYRHEQNGSFFIHILCQTLEEKASTDHLYDIFTEVTNKIVKLSAKYKLNQVPIFKSTLRNKVYLKTSN